MKKVRKIFCVFFTLFIFSVFLSGCQVDFKDINQKSIVTAVAVDKKGDEIYIYAEIANIEAAGKSENRSGTGKKYIHAIGHGKTIAEARKDLDRQIDKEIYVSAVRALILTENFAKEYLVEYLYRIRADELYRKKTFTVITKEDPEILFKTCNEKDVSVGFYTEELLKTLEKAGESFTRTTTRLLENLSEKYTGILVPCIGLYDQNVALVGYSVVYNTTIVGLIPVEGAKGIVFIKADKPKFYYIVSYRNNQFAIEVKLKKRKVKPTYENAAINYQMKFDFEAKLLLGHEKTPYSLTDTDYANIERSLTEVLRSELSDAVDQAQKKFKSDYVQFDDEFRIKYPSEFEKMDWQTEFEKATYNIDVNVVLSGALTMDYETGEQK